ncbi:MAG TPA: type ISP restriction/modification enzyme [Terriglobia bacterium]|nr:type ISP restriction/modification enzyme [Terriglobia bacterium]
MAASPIEVYRRQIEKELKDGNATEHTHRPALKTLLQALAPKITATNEPKRVECGAPDFAVTEKRAHGPVTMGHLEAKDVGKDLDEAQKSEQMKRYLPALPNLILTDYLEFRWYVDGEHRQTARLARASKGGKLVPEQDGAEAVTQLLTGFLAREAEPINDPKTLALRMARLTHLIRDMIVKAFEAKAASATLRDLHGAFEKALIPDLPIPQFADMFAQTLAYGLFAARCNHHGPTGSFKRLGAASEIPKTNPFLRQLFETITGTALDEEPFVGFVDDLAQLLADTDIGAVLADFGRRTARQDPVVHFYETFLAAYDPKLREARGVYYTPEPVVSYLVRSVDYLLKARFGCANGLADTATIEYERGDVGAIHESPLQKATSPRVLILDPACGTGTFLYAVIDHIRAEFMRQGNAGMWSGYVRSHLLPRIFGFELLMAPYAVAHFKLGMQLAGNDLTPALREKWAYDFSGDERLGVYLTNTLEEAERRAETLFGPLRVITQEGNAAAKIKSELPILAVIGNPPYSGHSANRSWEVKNGKKELTFIGRLIQDYYKVDGQPLGEKNPKWLQDDYVKFIRWGQWRIERTGAGVLAFITNHGYLDNPTFRGMRQQLMNAFSEIYVLDLHGNAKKKESAPDGSKDENVFDIQQGVTLGIFVKDPVAPASPLARMEEAAVPAATGRQDAGATNAGAAGPGIARVFHADLWGLREAKYERLFEAEVQTTRWTKLEPQSPSYLFMEQNRDLAAEYGKGWKLPDVFPVNSVGITTARDALAIDFSETALLDRVRDFISLPGEEARVKYGLGDDARDWKVSLAQEDIRRHGVKEQYVAQILYRPFDLRFTYYTAQTRGFICMPRPEVMRHMLGGQNPALLATRQTRDKWDVLTTRHIAAHKSVAGYDITGVFPLYCNEGAGPPVTGQTELAVLHAATRRPNLNPEFIADLEKRLGLKFVPEGKGDVAPGFSPASEQNADLKVGATTFGPEDVFNYIYAVFHSPTYRRRYAEFLKSDFPRVPLTSDVNLFRSLCGLGAELVALHLLESPTLQKPMARFPVKGSNQVDKGFPRYVAPGEPEPGTGKPLKDGRVYINKGDAVVAAVSDRRDEYGVRELAPAFGSGGKPPQSKGAAHRAALLRAKTGDEDIAATTGQYFEGVPPEVWNFHIGGYQVCEKWLKDRRGRTLTYEDLEHYRKVVTALSETIRLMAAIDSAIPKWPIE